MKRWGLFLFGAGAGAVTGVQIGGPAMLPALVAVAAGLLLLALGARSGQGDLVGDAMAARGTPEAAKPSLAGLGSRVEQILSLAKAQADDHIATAEATAARIVAEARAEAARISPE